jgi:DNA-binding IclR family transcriptional regulator
MIQPATNFDSSRFSNAVAGVSAKLRLRSTENESFKASRIEGSSLCSLTVRNPKNTIPAVNRALDLVRILAEGEDETNTKALALRLGMPPTTCYRILCSLIGRGWVQRVTNGRHVLSPGLRPVLQPLLWAEQVTHVMQPRLFELAGRVHSDVTLSLRQGDYAVTIAHGGAAQRAPVSAFGGAAFHLTTGSSGAVFLSRCKDDAIREVLHRTPPVCWTHQRPEDVWQRIKACRAKGWCADRSASRQRLNSISAPLCNERREIIAAMTLVGGRLEHSSRPMAVPVETLIQAARQLEKELCQLGSSTRTAGSQNERQRGGAGNLFLTPL